MKEDSFSYGIKIEIVVMEGVENIEEEGEEQLSLRWDSFWLDETMGVWKGSECRFL